MNMLNYINKIISEKEGELFKLSDKIWDLAELGLVEYKTKELYFDFLKKEGFEVETPVDYLPTSFLAKYGNGKPVIGITAEYDALPNFSQKENSFEKEINVKNKNSGHACGHNLLGVGSLTAALILKEYIKANKVSGTVVIIGTPSEERDAAKAFMAKEGVFNELDVAFTWHPEYKTQIWTQSSLANVMIKYHFKGKRAHASASPEFGRSALDAAELMNIGVNFLREHIIPEARVHYAFTDVGGEAPNVVQSTSTLYYFIRAPKINDAMSIYERVKKIAKGAAQMTETEVVEEYLGVVSDYIPNMTLTKLLYKSMCEIGSPKYDEEEIELAKNYYNTLSEKERSAARQLVLKNFNDDDAEEIFDDYILSKILPYKDNFSLLPGSTDVGDLSHCVPTAQALVATSVLGTPLHSWQMASQGKTSISKKGFLTAGSMIALTGIKVLNNNDIVKKAKEELNRELGSDGFVSPMPKDFTARNPKINP